MSKFKVVTDEVKEMIQSGDLDPAKAVEFIERISNLPKVKRTYIPPTAEDLKGRYMGDLQLRFKAKQSEIPFIHRQYMEVMKLYPGFILVGGVSGTGKSTTAANLLAGFIQHSNKKAFLVTNEDSMADAYDRTACCLENVDFKKYRNYRLDSEPMERVEARSRNLMNRILIEGGSESYDMTCLEDVQAVLIHIAEHAGDHYGLAMVDYLQTVNHSRERPDLEPVQVSKKLGFFLKDYARRVPIPVVVFVQLRPEANDDGDFKSRIQNDRTIFDHSFMAVEVKPDYDNKTSKFFCAKDRYWNGLNQEIEMKYQGGMFVPVDGEGI